MCCTLQALAFLGFGVAVIWIESMANEIVNLLQVRIGGGGEEPVGREAVL